MKNKKPDNGFTLLEILVAISIFAFLCVVLASLIKISFDLWRGSERQGDVTDRRQIILEALRTDFESIYTEKETREITKNIIEGDSLPDCVSVIEPCFYTDTDPVGNHWIYLVRTDNDALYEFTGGNIPSKKLIRVLYYIKTITTGDTSLCRVTLDKNTAVKFFEEKQYETMGFPISSQEFVFDDVIYLGVKLIVDETTTKDKWDSLPEDKDDLNPSSDENILVVKQTLPPAVELELVLRPTIFSEPNVILNSDNGNSLVVSHTHGLPTPPGYIKINQEWVSYNKLTRNTIYVDGRGARNTIQDTHPANTPMIYGETLKQLLYLTTSGRAKTAP